jgi:hypothetical protein
MCVPLLELLHDLRRAFKVLWIWFALLYLFRTVRKPQVLPGADRTQKVSQSAKQASFRVTLLCASLLRERTSQDLVRVHCYYWSMVVLWPGLRSSGDLPTTWRRHFSGFLYFSGHFFLSKKQKFWTGAVMPHRTARARHVPLCRPVMARRHVP